MPEQIRKSVGFEIRAEGSVGALYKSEDADDFVIWGPASVEVVDKEDDRIKSEALEDALPQLLKRASLSYEHSDQIVGEILDKFETEEPVTVEVGDTTLKRSEFPTDVIEDELDEPALFVAGNVYNDTQKARDVREAIEDDEIKSYSISGEAIVTSMAVEDGQPVNDIEKIDLSAVTLCREGMNQMAKFGVVKKSAEPSADASPAGDGDDTVQATPQHLKKHLKNMSDNDEAALTKTGMREILDETLPDGELATKQDVQEEVAAQLQKENATNTKDESEGSTDRPSGEDSNPVEQDDVDEGGDSPDETASDPDKMEEKSQGITMKELEEALPSDQFKAIEPVLEEKMGDDPMEDPLEDEGDGIEVVDEEEDEDEGLDEYDEVPPEEEEMVEEKAKALGLDPSSLDSTQRRRLSKAEIGGIEEAGGASAPSSSSENPLDAYADDENENDLIKSAEGSTMAGSAFFDENGGVQL